MLTPPLLKSFMRSFPVEHEFIHFGGHLFPIEQPQKTATLLVDIMRRMESGDHSKHVLNRN